MSALVDANWRLETDDHLPALVSGQGKGRRLPGTSHLLFTSGTGGEPAAVVVPADVFRSSLGWYVRTFGISRTDRTAMLSGLGHDPILRDIFAPLLAGGVLVVPPAEAPTRPDRLVTFLQSRGITVLHTTPALLDLATAQESTLAGLRLIVSGGAPLTAELVQRTRRLTDAVIVNAYGTTETPQLGTWAVVSDEPAVSSTGTAALDVVTQAGQPAGIGQRGEVVVRSRHLATGYLDAAGRDGAFGAGTAGVRTFRTGDLGRLRPSGTIQLDGRLDRQVQVNGFRIELAEVEAAASRCPGVAQAVAGLVEDLLLLQVVPIGGTTVDDLRRQLRWFLPAYAVPARIQLVPSLSRSVNHKVVADPVRAGIPAARVPPGSGPTLLAILRTLAALLDRPVGPDENFLEAGLNSIGLLRLHGRLQDVVGSSVRVSDLFSHPDARALAARLDERGRTRSGRAGSRLSAADLHDMREVRRAARALFSRRKG